MKRLRFEITEEEYITILKNTIYSGRPFNNPLTEEDIIKIIPRLK